MTDEDLARHIELYHTYDREAVERMLAEHRTLVDDIMPEFSMMIDDLYGKKRPVPGDPHHRDGGRLAELSNGGVKLRLSPFLNVLIAGSFVLLAAIAGALITSLLS